MKQKMIVVSLMIMVLVFLSSPVAAQETFQKYNFKFSLGYGGLTGGDISNVTKGMNDLLADLASLSGGTVTDELGYPKWGPDFEAEFIYNINKNFGIGIGSGYISRKGEYQGGLAAGDFGSYLVSWDLNYTEIPIIFNGYYFFPLGSKLKGFLKAGIGYYMGKLKFDIYQEASADGETGWERSVGEAKDGGLGFQGGLGLEFPVARNVALIAEATGRYVNLNSWDVENSYSTSWGFTEEETGYFWYGEQFEEDLGKYYPTLMLDATEPSDPSLRGVKKAAFSSTGFVLKLGIKIGF